MARILSDMSQIGKIPNLLFSFNLVHSIWLSYGPNLLYYSSHFLESLQYFFHCCSSEVLNASKTSVDTVLDTCVMFKFFIVFLGIPLDT